MIDSLVRWLSPGGVRGAHQVLHLHRVLAHPDPMLPHDPDRTAFESLLACLKRAFVILPLDEAVDRMQTGRLPPASLSLTFDDGYADNATQALPALQAHGLTATFFVTTGYLDGGRMWNDTVIEAVRRLEPGPLDLRECGLGEPVLGQEPEDRTAMATQLIRAIKHRSPADRQQFVDFLEGSIEGLPGDLMMSSEQVRQLADAGMGIGAHTVSHPILSRLADDKAFDEMAEGKSQLETLLGRPVDLFAYPNGKYGLDYDDRHAAMAREIGFRAAFSTDPGVSRQGAALWRLPRFTPWDASCRGYKQRLLMNRYGLIR